MKRGQVGHTWRMARLQGHRVQTAVTHVQVRKVKYYPQPSRTLGFGSLQNGENKHFIRYLSAVGVQQFPPRLKPSVLEGKLLWHSCKGKRDYSGPGKYPILQRCSLATESTQPKTDSGSLWNWEGSLGPSLPRINSKDCWEPLSKEPCCTEDFETSPAAWKKQGANTGSQKRVRPDQTIDRSRDQPCFPDLQRPLFSSGPRSVSCHSCWTGFGDAVAFESFLLP